MATTDKSLLDRLSNVMDLLNKKSGEVSILETSEVNECSETTVYSDVKYLVNYYDNYLDIGTTGGIIKTRNNVCENYQYILNCLMASQTEILILRDIIERPGQSIKEHSATTFRNRQTVKAIIQILVDKLAQDDVRLNSRNRLLLEGDEYKIRVFIASFYYYFQSAFSFRDRVPSFKLNYMDQLSANSDLLDFLYYLEKASILRNMQGFRMKSSDTHNVMDVEHDISQTIYRYCNELQALVNEKEETLKTIIDELNVLGYGISEDSYKSLYSIIAHIMISNDKLFSFYKNRKFTIDKFMINHLESVYNKYDMRNTNLRSLFKTLTDGNEQLIGCLVYYLETNENKKKMPSGRNIAIYCDFSVNYGNAMVNFISSIFPNNYYFLYHGNDKQSQQNGQSLEDFMNEHNCCAVVSARNLIKDIAKPSIAINSFANEEDIGRMYYFFRCLNNHKD
ncbi:hypothetical protein AOC36_09050 [Erysipelothrix larvae]|uniref:Mga helix-turn-helix domain-containing protein n=1 Tax=Erysipelothrix larvae TaxID=1514105 RepID=A0A0X8H175_9FIRM|nr:helix-turn-helix domain-containing protein [Erysipelothrix larvae]AMC94130.1 hypothetical protein AOC36_09050 [Erysipelothrix larvae]